MSIKMSNPLNTTFVSECYVHFSANSSFLIKLRSTDMKTYSLEIIAKLM
jgi:hypothetical protein